LPQYYKSVTGDKRNVVEQLNLNCGVLHFFENTTLRNNYVSSSPIPTKKDDEILELLQDKANGRLNKKQRTSRLQYCDSHLPGEKYRIIDQTGR
jgi:hypothetical protein